jgi:hypothetical protein
METDTDLNENIGILLIGHGSSLPYEVKYCINCLKCIKKFQIQITLLK